MSMLDLNHNLLSIFFFFFFFNDTATTEIYTLSLHDALPISWCRRFDSGPRHLSIRGRTTRNRLRARGASPRKRPEHADSLPERVFRKIGAKKGRPGRCYRAANVLLGWRLAPVLLAGKKGRPVTSRKFRKVRETSPRELGPEARGRHVDRRLRPHREREERRAAGREDAGQLVEEGDHVRERHELERVVGVGEPLGIALLEADAPCKLGRGLTARLRQHRPGEVDADDLGVREAARDCERAYARPRPHVERPARRRLDRLERGLERGERLRAAHRVPDGCEAVELQPRQPSQEAPGPGLPHYLVRRKPGEPSAEPLKDAHSATLIRTSTPGCAENVSAALPPLTAIAMFSYASS